MKSIRLLDRRAGYSLSAIGLLLGMVAPAVLPAFASADLLESRSVTMSSSVKDDSGVSYNIKFTAAGNIGATASDEGGIVIGFCSDSPLLGAPCTMPAGFSTSGVGVTGVKYGGTPAGSNGTVTAVDYTNVPNANSGVKWTAGSAYTGGTTFEMTLTGIHNPTNAGSFYVRISTYADKTALTSWTDDDTLGSSQDDGAVALSTTDSVGVTAYVLESMTFCVSKGNVGDTGDPDAVDAQGEPSENCGQGHAGCPASDGCLVTPDLTLGQLNGTVNALATNAVSTGEVYAQLSTNASAGAVVNLKSDAAGCGGLYRNGDVGECNIAPQTAAGGITAGNALFGIITGTASVAPTAAGGAGTGQGDSDIVYNAAYGASDFFLDYDTDDDDATGVTSTYGSELFHTDVPVNNVNVPFTFGASISNLTPAGNYGANFNLIATGTF